MDSIHSPSGMKLVGIGEAVVLEVRASASPGAHEVRINHPDIGRTAFIPYSASAGLYRVPRVGDLCYVFCNENFHQYPIAWGHRISPQLAAALVGQRGDNITVVYSSGPNNNSVTHKIELDDGENSGIRVTTESGHLVELSNEGDISVTHKDGASVLVAGDSITLSAGGSTLTVSAAGIQLSATQGSSLTVGPSIAGTAADAKSTFDQVTVPNHIHIGNLGYPTRPPIKGT